MESPPTAGHSARIFFGMAETAGVTDPGSSEVSEKKKRGPGRPPKKEKPEGETRGLTVAQKAEAVALWRSGDYTLEMLAKKFGKRREQFSRLFKRMGIEKGSGVAAATAKAVEAAEARASRDTEEVLQKIAKIKEQHLRMSTDIAKLAYAEILRARQAGLDMGTLKDVMATLKAAGEIVANARKEAYVVLDVEKHEKDEDLESLPELTVRELTNDEITQLQQAPGDDGLDDDMGELGDDLDMLPGA